MTIPEEQLELEKLRFDYSWKWFAFHADQRTKFFNFMILVEGALATATATAYDTSHANTAVVLCVTGAIFALIFAQLDRRNRDLVWLGEDVLVELERRVIFGEYEKIKDREKREIPFGILRRQAREEVYTGMMHDALAGKHRFWNQAIAYLFILLFVLLFIMNA